MPDLEYLQNELNQIALGSPTLNSKKPLPKPRWEVGTENLIDNISTRWSGKVVNETDYSLIKKDLDTLNTYLPTLKGETRAKCEIAIKTLEEKIRGYKTEKLPGIIAEVGIFLKQPISSDEEVDKATLYLDELCKRREKTATGTWANILDSYINQLQEAINKFEGTKAEFGSPEVASEIKNVPDWVRGFYTITTRLEQVAKERGWEVPKHTVDSKYCKVEEITPGREYRLGFEDRDEEFSEKMGGPPSWPKPDYDFDEPLIYVSKADSTITVKVEKYGGFLASDIYYGDKKVFSGVGGWPIKMHVGQTRTVEAPTPPIVPPAKPPVISPEIKSKILSYLPWVVSLGALIIGGIAIVGRKK